MRSTRKRRTGRPSSLSGMLPYSTLLRVGFTVPPLLPVTRCALTAPFHPYLRLRGGGVFSVALSVGSPLPRVTRHTALWSSDFPRSCSAEPRLPGRLRTIILAHGCDGSKHAVDTPRQGHRSVFQDFGFGAGAGGGGLTRPSSSRSLADSSFAISGRSRRKILAFSRPWPRRSPL